MFEVCFKAVVHPVQSRLLMQSIRSARCSKLFLRNQKKLLTLAVELRKTESLLISNITLFSFLVGALPTYEDVTMTDSVRSAGHAHGSEGLPRFMEELRAFTHRLSTIEKDIAALPGSELDESILNRVLEAVDASVEACRNFEIQCGDDKALLVETQALFRRETAPFFSQSWFANRARTKPSGFSGDFEMLCKIYGDKKENSGIGAYLDKIFMGVPLACAVRGRLEMAKRLLQREVESRGQQEDRIRILDIASGPCREYLDWPSHLPAIDVLAMDNDPRAIEYVNATVAPQMPKASRLESIQYNAFRTRSSETTVQKFGRFDIIYSVGLCDYLTDDVLIKLLAAWHDTLAENGLLFVAFKDTLRYDQAVYQWHLDWFFYQRTVQDVLSLYDKAGFDLGNIETSRDQTGIITGFFTRRMPGRHLRIDAPEAIVRRPTITMYTNQPATHPSNSRVSSS